MFLESGDLFHETGWESCSITGVFLDMTQCYAGVRAIRDQIIVLQDKPLDKLASGLYVPDSAARELQHDMGIVQAIGPDVHDVGPGERIMFRRRPESALITDKREGGRPEWMDVLMLREEDVLLIFDPEDSVE